MSMSCCFSMDGSNSKRGGIREEYSMTSASSSTSASRGSNLTWVTQAYTYWSSYLSSPSRSAAIISLGRGISLRLETKNSDLKVMQGYLWERGSVS